MLSNDIKAISNVVLKITNCFSVVKKYIPLMVVTKKYRLGIYFMFDNKYNI